MGNLNSMQQMPAKLTNVLFINTDTDTDTDTYIVRMLYVYLI